MRRLITGALFYSYTLSLICISVLPIAAPANTPENSDKLAHFLMYAILTLLAASYFDFKRIPSKIIVPLAVIYASLLGLFTEFLQVFVSFRSFEWADWLADSLGAVCLGLVVYTYQRVIPPRK